ncbi:hypothetical protein BD769DRAFT_1440249 [Suillus cothurnatus]|nr:hypothetical protein BD769DRAFT_1440249 [Suillus cothurnatus]
MLDAQENSTLMSDFDSLHISLDSRPPPGLQAPAIPSITEAQNPWSEEQSKLELKPINAAAHLFSLHQHGLAQKGIHHLHEFHRVQVVEYTPGLLPDLAHPHHNHRLLPHLASPQLAAIARTLSIPNVTNRVRPRPLSMDAARPIATPSPTTMTSFAQQQSQSTAPSPLSKQIPLPPKAHRTPGPRLQLLHHHLGQESPRKDKDPSFNFQDFLDQMKSRGSNRSANTFLSNFTKRTFTVNDQVKIINDFLSVLYCHEMRETDIWRNATEEEFDNAMEGMEKLVMNRLYEYTYTPCLPLLTPPRPVTADDLERDQLCKVNHYKAPRDKLICILNCCKVIFGLIRHLRKDEGADSLANPEHYFRMLSMYGVYQSLSKSCEVQSEAGYICQALSMGAVQFIESMDHTSLSSISQEEFERNVEVAIQTLPPSLPSSPTMAQGSQIPNQLPRSSPHAGEESAQPLALAVPSSAQNLTIGEDARKLLQKTGDVVSKPLGAISRIFSEALDDKMGYLPGPFAPFELGREERERHWSHPDQVAQFAGGAPYTPAGSEGLQAPIQTPYKPRVRRTSPVPTQPTYTGQLYGADETPSRTGSGGPYVNQALALGPAQPLSAPNAIPQHLQSPSVGHHISRTPTPSLDLSAVEAEIDRAHAQASAAARATLAQIFPGVDPEVREWVLEANGGDLGKSIEGLLDMAGGS